jgi:hypothetical protein
MKTRRYRLIDDAPDIAPQNSVGSAGEERATLQVRGTSDLKTLTTRRGLETKSVTTCSAQRVGMFIPGPVGCLSRAWVEGQSVATVAESRRVKRLLRLPEASNAT